MANGSPMSAAAKDRLRELAAAKKGRETLQGLDPYGWCAAFDALQNGDVVFPKENQIATRAGIELVDGQYFPMRWTFQRADKVHRNLITHVKLKHARDDQHEKIREVFGAVPAVHYVFAGPGRGREPQAFWLYPVAPILRLFWAIWPGEKDDWAGKVKKYLHGFTASTVVKMNPDDFDPLPSYPPGFGAAVSSFPTTVELLRLAKLL